MDSTLTLNTSDMLSQRFRQWFWYVAAALAVVGLCSGIAATFYVAAAMRTLVQRPQVPASLVTYGDQPATLERSVVCPGDELVFTATLTIEPLPGKPNAARYVSVFRSISIAASGNPAILRDGKTRAQTYSSERNVHPGVRTGVVKIPVEDLPPNVYNLDTTTRGATAQEDAYSIEFTVPPGCAKP